MNSVKLGLDLLEHELVSNRDATNVIGAVRLNGRLNLSFLTFVRFTTVVRDVVVAEENGHVDLGLFDGLELKQV